jgi:hypothetical protein
MLALNGAAPIKELSKTISLERYAKPSRSPGNVDYEMGGVRTNMPRFIASPVGVTIYNATKYYDYKNNVRRYEFFKR